MSNNLQNQTTHNVGCATIGVHPFFALIIGINDYVHWSRLGGAVSDAQSMRAHLINAFQVSEENIITLYNKEASRTAIIGAFRKLRDNERIHRGDPIVIFYAGHGGSHRPPREWSLTGRIESLVPQNCAAARSELSSESEDAPIPDRTIGALIKEIAGKKGDNITVIFDCCFSSSATRKDEEEEYIPRGIYLDLDIPASLDEDIWEGRAGSVPESYACHGVRTHILLAACAENEVAYECKNSKRGQFTTALLDTLVKCSVNHLTYTELIGKIRFKNQRPQCVGSKQNRFLFNARVPDGSLVFHQIRQESGEYVINAGLAHGVSHASGAEFTLYDARKDRVCSVVADETFSIGDFETKVARPAPHAGVSYAKLTRVGKLPLYAENHSAVYDILYNFDPGAQQFQLVGAEEAKLEVGMESNRVVFKVLDERVKRFGLTVLSHEATPNVNVLAHVFAFATRYYWYLGLAKEHALTPTKRNVSIDFYLLNLERDVFGIPSLTTIEPGLCKKDPNLDNSDVIDFVVDEGAIYGIEITNNTSKDLYLNAFLFNNSDLSVVPCYTQSNAGTPDVPLKRGGVFTIGYGTGGTPPLSYSLSEHQDIDVSYLKIFFATQPIDMSYIVQPSPFLSMDGRGGVYEGEGDREDMITPLKKVATAVLAAVRWTPQDKWFTVSIPVVQRRSAAVFASTV